MSSVRITMSIHRPIGHSLVFTLLATLTRNDSVKAITPALVALYTGPVGSGSKPADIQ